MWKSVSFNCNRDKRFFESRHLLECVMLTFLHRASAIMVIRLPGTPTKINKIQDMEANIKSPVDIPGNRTAGSEGSEII